MLKTEEKVVERNSFNHHHLNTKAGNVDRGIQFGPPAGLGQVQQGLSGKVKCI